ncbi:MAG: histidinol-phosphatase HisJ family protein [Lachnospiraceae bacterium]|nr:histidinol-phosphatase HisJ family protein [Lachnospiraceae bacterium]
MSILYDFHLHSAFSGDSDTPSEDMILRAQAAGLCGMCFTEHLDLDAPYDDPDFTLDFSSYFPGIHRLQEDYYNKIQIGVGMEFGIQPHLPATLAELNRTYSFDFIIASLHFVQGMDPYYPDFFEGRREQECYEEFFQAEFDTLRKFLPTDYDTLGHMDYIVRYGPNRNRNYSYSLYADYIDPILRFLIDNGKCLELNTGGYKYGLGEPNPCADIFRRYRQLGGELITIGSDAHSPEHIAYGFEQAAALLQSIGFRYYTVFEKRKGRQVRL